MSALKRILAMQRFCVSELAARPDDAAAALGIADTVAEEVLLMAEDLLECE